MKKKIFVLTHNYPRDEQDFAGIFIKNLNNDLAQEFDFTVCPIRFGTTMHKLYKNPFNWPKLYSYFHKARKIAEAEIAKDKYDLIWAHWWMPPGIIAAKLARKTGLPLMVTCHGTDAFMLRDLPPLRFFAERVFNTAKTVNVVSKYMSTITTPDAVVANMPYNQEVFNYNGESKDDNYIICPTALIKRKNVGLLVKAVKNIPELKLKIFGDGILRDEIKTLIADSENIELHPPIDHARLSQEYKKAGAIVLPSVNEGFGLTLVEGAASGCLPLATIDGGMVEIIEQIGGIKFPYDESSAEIEKALRKYLDMLPLDRQKIADSAKVFSRKSIIPRFKHIINSAISA